MDSSDIRISTRNSSLAGGTRTSTEDLCMESKEKCGLAVGRQAPNRRKDLVFQFLNNPVVMSRHGDSSALDAEEVVAVLLQLLGLKPAEGREIGPEDMARALTVSLTVVRHVKVH